MMGYCRRTQILDTSLGGNGHLKVVVLRLRRVSRKSVECGCIWLSAIWKGGSICP